MAGPSATWDTKRVHITYRNVLSGLLEAGTWTAKIDVRVTNTGTDGKRQVFRQGNLGSGPLNTIEGQPSLDIDLPIIDDPQNTPNGGAITLLINFASGGSETFKLSPLMSWPDVGTDLALILNPAVVAAAPPVNMKGIPGGVAALDAQGYVLNAAGQRIVSGTGDGTGGSINWGDILEKPAVIAAGSTQAQARTAIAVLSSTEVNNLLASKLNTSTYNSGMSGKANLIDGLVPMTEIPQLSASKVDETPVQKWLSSEERTAIGNLNLEVQSLTGTVSSLSTQVADLQEQLNNTPTTGLVIKGVVNYGEAPPLNQQEAGQYWAVRTSGTEAPPTPNPPTFVGYVYAAPLNTSATVLTLPSGTATGDTVLVGHTYNCSNGLSPVGPLEPYSSKPGADWTGLTSVTHADSTRRFETYTKVLTAAEAQDKLVTMNYAGPQKGSAIAIVLRNVGTVTGSSALRTTSETAKVTPTLTTAGKAIHISLYGERQTDPTVNPVPPSGQNLTLQTPIATSGATQSGGTTAAVAINMTPTAGAGSIGGGSWTLPAARTTSFVTTVAVAVT